MEQAQQFVMVAVEMLDECIKAQYPSRLFINAMTHVVNAFTANPELANEVGRMWGDDGLDATTIREMSLGGSMQDPEKRKQITDALRGFIALRAPQANGNVSNMWAQIPETLTERIPTPVPMRSSTIEIDVVEELPQAVIVRLSETLIFKPKLEMAVPETSGALAKIVDKPPPSAIEVETQAQAIEAVKRLRAEVKEVNAGVDKDKWRLPTRTFIRRFNSELLDKVLRDSPISHEKFMKIVEHGVKEESDPYVKFRTVFTERMGAFLILRLLELCWPNQTSWPEIMELAQELIVSDKEWKEIFGATRKNTPVRGVHVPLPRAQEVSRAYRHLDAVYQKKLVTPW